MLHTIKTALATLIATAALIGCGPESQFTPIDAEGSNVPSSVPDELEIGTSQQAATVGSRPIHVQRYGPFGNGGTLSTGFPSSTWIATVVGIKTTDGDINEVGTGNPLMAYPFQSNGIWNVTFDLRSHRDNESWEIWVMFINRSMATSTGF